MTSKQGLRLVWPCQARKVLVVRCQPQKMKTSKDMNNCSVTSMSALQGMTVAHDNVPVHVRRFNGSTQSIYNTSQNSIMSNSYLLNSVTIITFTLGLILMQFKVPFDEQRPSIRNHMRHTQSHHIS